MSIIEFTLFGRPESFRQLSNETIGVWKKYIKEKVDIISLATKFHGKIPADRPVSVEIIHFYSGGNSQDVDNCAKPILDCMQGPIYKNDNLVHSLRYEKYCLNTVQACECIKSNALIRVAYHKAQALEEDFVYVGVQYFKQDAAKPEDIPQPRPLFI